jgi:hypothetical protein
MRRKGVWKLKPAPGPPAGVPAERSESGAFIELESAQIHTDTLLLRVSYDKSLTKYLTTGLFYARYDFPIEGVPLSILSIPLVGLLAPLGWLTGAEIQVGEVDEEYLNSLRRVAQGFKRMFPRVSFSGRIQAHPVKINLKWDQKKYCLLYSRGVDSTSSLIRNFEKRPSLLTVRGTLDLLLREDRYWTRVQQRVQPFTEGLGLESHVVETNAVDMVNLAALNADFEDQLGIGWWEGLAHGLFLLSVCAPYTFLNRTGNVMIASSHTLKNQKPWGSSPMTDEEVRWGGVRVIHDSYDLQRVEKIRKVLIPHMKSSGSAIPLRVCIGKEAVKLASNQLNCGQCSKCMLIELTLIVSGADASENGFDISPASLLALRHNLEVGWFDREYDPTTWKFIKENAKSPPAEIVTRHPGLREFFDWFAEWDERSTKKRRRYLDRVAPRGSRRRDMAKAMLGKKGEPEATGLDEPSTYHSTLDEA